MVFNFSDRRLYTFMQLHNVTATVVKGLASIGLLRRFNCSLQQLQTVFSFKRLGRACVKSESDGSNCTSAAIATGALHHRLQDTENLSSLNNEIKLLFILRNSSDIHSMSMMMTTMTI